MVIRHRDNKIKEETPVLPHCSNDAEKWITGMIN
jgi:hypothetical protein